MKLIKKVEVRDSLYMSLLYQEQIMSVAHFIRRFPQYSRATIYRLNNRPLRERTDRWSSNRGRLSKLSEQDIR